MKHILPIAIFILFSQAVFAQSSSDTSAIVSLSSLKFHYMTSSLTDSLAAVMDDAMLVQHAGGGMVQTKADYLDNIKTGMLKYDSIRVSNVRARVIGSTAFVLGLATFNIKFRGKPMKFDFAYAETYAFVDGKWKMALYSVQRSDKP